MRYIIKINHKWRTATRRNLPIRLQYQAQEIYQEEDTVSSPTDTYKCIKSITGDLDKVIGDKEALLLQLQSTPLIWGDDKDLEIRSRKYSVGRTTWE